MEFKCKEYSVHLEEDKTTHPSDDYTIFKYDFLSALNDADRCFVPLQSSGVGAFVKVPVNITHRFLTCPSLYFSRSLAFPQGQTVHLIRMC